MDHIWQPIGIALQVLRHTRDLGTHVSFGASMIGITINQRIDEAIKTAQQIAHMPSPIKIEATLIRMAVFPKGLYGIEAAPCTLAKLRKLRTVILGIIGPCSTLRSPAMVFAAAADGDDLDPLAQIASLRTTTLRRYLAWYPHLKTKALGLLDHYLRKKREDDEDEAQQGNETEGEDEIDFPRGRFGKRPSLN